MFSSGFMNIGQMEYQWKKIDVNVRYMWIKNYWWVNILSFNLKNLSDFIFCLNPQETDKDTIIKRLKRGMRLLLEQ